MSVKFYLRIVAIAICFSSCLKQSIPDAMLNPSGGNNLTATFSYDINGSKVSMSVKQAARQVSGSRRLSIEKANGYILSAVTNDGEFVFTFYTDSLKVGNYKYLSSYGASYVTTFEGRPQYVYAASDNMDFNITGIKEGHISGNFSGKLTPATSPGYYGAIGSVVITNGSFSNIPVFY